MFLALLHHKLLQLIKKIKALQKKSWIRGLKSTNFKHDVMTQSYFSSRKEKTCELHLNKVGQSKSKNLSTQRINKICYVCPKSTIVMATITSRHITNFMCHILSDLNFEVIKIGLLPYKFLHIGSIKVDYGICDKMLYLPSECN